MTGIEIRCPTCGVKGEIEVSPDAMKGVARGLLAINIADGTICEHSFIAYVDRNLDIRDYFVADFKIEIPQIPVANPERFKQSKIPTKEIVDMDLIKLNLQAIILTYVLKSIFSKQKIIIISDYEFLFDHINNFFKYVTHDTFEVNLMIIPEKKYTQNKKNYKDYMVFKGNQILRNVNKAINPKKLHVEKHIIKNFITEQELGYSYIALRNEIQKAYELSKSIKDFIKEKEEQNEKPNLLEISASLEHKYSVKISQTYLNFLIEIVKNYFGMTVPTVSQSFLGAI